MDTQTLASNARARYNHQVSLEILKEKYSTQLIVAHGGGMWRITPELIGYLNSVTGEKILLDIYNTPVKIDTKSFYDFAVRHYDNIMSLLLEEHTKLSRQR